MDFVVTFLQLFLFSVILFAPVLVALSLSVIVIGQIVGHIESWSRFDALYWSFITASTVGYGDIRPGQRVSKALSVMIAFTGVIFTGIIVAIAVQTASTSYDRHLDTDDLSRCIELLQ